MFSPSHLNTKKPPPRRMGRYALYLGAALIVLWVGVQAISFIPSATAQESDSPSEEEAVVSSSSSGAGIEVFTWGNVAAVLLLAGGGGVAWYLQQNGATSSANALLRSVGTLSMGPSQQLRLVVCADEVLLLGVTDEEVSLLKAYPREAFDDHPALAEADPEGAMSNGTTTAGGLPGDFSDVLDHFVRQDASA